VRDEGIFCLLFVQKLGILVDTGELFQTKPHPSLRENWKVPSNIALLDTDELLQILEMNARLRTEPIFFSKLFIELRPYGQCCLGCMAKKVEHRTFSQSRLCKFVLDKFLRPISLHVSYPTLEVLQQR
jgi:hypothetical protein